MRQLQHEAEVDDALAAPRFLLFKHSLICPVSTAAFSHYEAFCAGHPDVPTAWIDVIGGRPMSQRVAAVTNVTHESPQALLLEHGVVRWHASHHAITADALTAACAP